MGRRLGMLTFAIWMTSAICGHAVTLRYAIVIGNNVGVDQGGQQPFPPLKHAEREASKLRKQLVGLSNFDASNKRTRLLLGGGRDQVAAAFRSLAAQKAKDEALLGDVDSIFLLYFTGHGQEGRILLRDGPLTSKALSNLFNLINADFAVGVFDACYAGGLYGALAEKGIDPTPGYNMIEELPNEVLSAKGSVWFVSSGSGEPSYEDDQIGGVFTHFFIEAMSKAEQEGPGITLDQIWKYARGQTISFTAARNRHQIPEQIISQMRVKAPIYFSFPVKRSATLSLSEKLAGRFTLSYADGHLTEVFEKSAGERQDIAVYPGSAKLVLIGDDNERQAESSFYVSPGGKILLHTLSESDPAPALGQRAKTLWTKGIGLHHEVQGTSVAPGISLVGGVGYEASFAVEELLNPRHLFGVPIRVDLDHVFFGLKILFGYDRRSYAAWGYRAHLVGSRLFAGYAWDAGPTRLGVDLGFRFGHIWQRFESDASRAAWQFQPDVRFVVLWPRATRSLIGAYTQLGPCYLPGAANGSESGWHVAGGVGVSGYFRFL